MTTTKRHAAISLASFAMLAAPSAFADPAAPEAPPAAAVAAAAAPAAPVAAPAAPKPKAWYDVVKVEAFVDAYGSYNANAPKPQAGANTGHAYDANTGFALNWAGVNATVAAEPVGGTVSLRFGQAAHIYNGAGLAGTDSANGMTLVKQAYATWKPGGADGKLTLDFGKYDQPFGSEVADSQYNINYTRGLLYWYAQPLFFTGVRADYAVSDTLDVKLFAMNGWNASVDNNAGKTVGAQINLQPSATSLIAIGWAGGPEQADVAGGAAVEGQNMRFRHLVDVVGDFTFDKLRLLGNFDYGMETVLDPADASKTKKAKWYGGSLAASYTISDTWMLGARGEYYADPDGFTVAGAYASADDTKKLTLVSATATIAAKPTPNLMLKLDGRMDKALDDKKPFPKGIGDAPTDSQITATLGVVVTTN